MDIKNTALSVAIAFVLAGCGGGSGGGSSEQKPVQPETPPIVTPPPNPEKPVVPPTTPVEQLTLLKEIRLADSASEITAQTFNLETWNPKAIATHGDVLYIANSSSAAQVLRYDLKTKRVLPSLNPEVVTGIKQVWNGLNDISIYKDRLYVASYQSNRVDVFDIGSGEPQFVMSLGTGVWWGDENYALVHTHAVAANDQYVFVPDIQGRINVWQQADVIANNHLKAPKYARLALPDCERYCEVKLEVIADELYASTNNGNTYIFDIKAIKKGDIGIAQVKQQNGIANIYHQSDDGLFYASRTSGAIESFKVSALQGINTAIPQAIDQIHKYRLEGSDATQTLAKATDFTVYKQNILQISNNKIINLPLRSLQQKQSNAAASTIQLKKANATQTQRMLQDNESWETLTNVSARHVYMDKILSAQLTKDGLRLQSYSAVPVKDLQIQAKLKNTSQWILLAKLDELDAFSAMHLKLSMNDASRFKLMDGQGSIQLAGLSAFQQFPAELFDFKITSQTDAHVQKLAAIKPKWKIYFGTYDQASDSKWRRINPLYAREWVMMMTNFAYVLSTPEFEQVWFNHQKVMGHDFFGNAGMVTGQNGIFLPQDYQNTYQNIMNRDEINLGITNMGGGLGGGKVLGVDTWLFYGHYQLSGLGIVAHEFGHHWGSHNSAWANGSYGFQPLIDQLFFYLQRKPKALPYMDRDVNKFYLAPSSQLYVPVSANILNGKPGTAPLNNVDRYFAANPLK